MFQNLRPVFPKLGGPMEGAEDKREEQGWVCKITVIIHTFPGPTARHTDVINNSRPANH
jgi:hypothetical protein